MLLTLLLAMLVIGLLASYNLHRSAEDHYIRAALPLRTATRDVLFQMELEETGVRGYMITGDYNSLDPYFAGRKGVVADLRRIAQLTESDPQLKDHLAAVRKDVVALHGFYDRLIAFVADGKIGRQRAIDEVLGGEALASRFREGAALLQSDTNRIIARTRHQQHVTLDRTLASLSIAGVLALGVALGLLVTLPERLRLLYASEEEARLRAEQGAHAAQALAHVSDAVFLVNDDGSIEFWNEAGEQLFGISAGEAVGRPASAVVPEYARLVEAARGEERFVPVGIDGDERWLSPVLTSFEGGSVLTVRDSTAGYVLERTRADFVATASHELRTPLTTVYGGARTLIAHRDTLGAGEQDQLLRMIEQESEHLVQIVDQLLVSAQLDRGGVHLDESDCDVLALCTSVVEFAQMRAAGKNIVLLQMPTAMAPLRCDQALLRQVLVNLVENGVKYSPDGGRVDLS